MRLTIRTIVCSSLIGCLLSCSADKRADARPSVIPLPMSEKRMPGEGFTFTSRTTIRIGDATHEKVARQLAGYFTLPAGFTPAVEITDLPGGSNILYFNTDTTMQDEAYTLEITSGQIQISAAGRSGFFYATQTLRSLLPPEISDRQLHNDVEWSVPALRMEDAPRFGYRGLMLDAARTFIPKEEVLKIVDAMGMLKLNKLHFHLVDDHGWRIEIKKYPRLTEVGAWRVDREEDFSARDNARPGEKATVGGFYTQDDIREIVAFAAERSIEVIPEIEMPAHTNSSLAAYPELACPVVKRPITVLPGIGGANTKIIYCAGNDSVFSFIQNVIDEIILLFPSRYIHVGGDEADKTYWKQCPLCQGRMKKEQIASEEELQSYFIRRVNGSLQSKGRQLMGWDELADSSLPEKAVIFGWRGMGQAAVKAAEQGHQVVMTPAKVLYLIRYQGPQWFEPRTYFGNNTLLDVYNYEPTEGMTENVARQVIGVQGCMWSEFLGKPEDLEYMLFPRLTALAERAWCGKEQRDWSDYLSRLDRMLQHYDASGITYATSMFNLDHEVVSFEDSLQVQVSSIRPDLEIRYTTDGVAPSAQSALWNGSPLSVAKTCKIQAATFNGGLQKGKVLALELKFNRATAKSIQGDNKQLPRLINGLRGSDKHSDGEWCGWNEEDAVFTVDLQSVQPIRTVRLGTINNRGMAAHAPRRVSIEYSTDGQQYKALASRDFTPAKCFAYGIFTSEIGFENLDTEARYLRFTLLNPGVCPAGHTREGQPTWIYLDELIVE